VVCIARLRREKGHGTLLQAFGKVRAELPDARLVLVGDGPMRAAIEAEAIRLGVAGAVEFAGAIPDIWPCLADADVFALASDREAFGIAVAEAMAAGLPVVAPATGGIFDLVDPGVTGDIFPPGDADGLARRLLAVLRDPERGVRMGEAGRARAQEFRMEASARRYLSLYDELASTR
jgi:glycosyltransferase involved in cell wall biosynthesis